MIHDRPDFYRGYRPGRKDGMDFGRIVPVAFEQLRKRAGAQFLAGHYADRQRDTQPRDRSRQNARRLTDREPGSDID